MIKSLYINTFAALSILVVCNIANAADFKSISNTVRQNPMVAKLIAKNGNKVQVIEFFSYGCGACARFEPKFDKWLQNNKGNYVVDRMPVSFNQEDWINLANLYFIMHDLNAKQNYSPKIFTAIHEQGMQLWEKPAMKQFAIQQGFSAEQFERTYAKYKDFQSVEHADQISDIYGVNQTPTIIVNGPEASYMITASQNDEDYFQVLNHVIDLAGKVTE